MKKATKSKVTPRSKSVKPPTAKKPSTNSKIIDIGGNSNPASTPYGEPNYDIQPVDNTIAQTEIYDPKTTLPIGIIIKNLTDEPQDVKILFPNAKKENNYGNAEHVVLDNIYRKPLSLAFGYNNLNNQLGDVNTYDDLLHFLRGKIVKIGAMARVLIRGSKSCIQGVVQLGTIAAWGVTRAVPIITNKDPYQVQNDILVNNTPFTLDNMCGQSGLLIMNFPPCTSMRLYFYFYQGEGKKSHSLIRILPTVEYDYKPQQFEIKKIKTSIKKDRKGNYTYKTPEGKFVIIYPIEGKGNEGNFTVDKNATKKTESEISAWWNSAVFTTSKGEDIVIYDINKIKWRITKDKKGNYTYKTRKGSIVNLYPIEGCNGFTTDKNDTKADSTSLFDGGEYDNAEDPYGQYVFIINKVKDAPKKENTAPTPKKKSAVPIEVIARKKGVGKNTSPRKRNNG